MLPTPPAITVTEGRVSIIQVAAGSVPGTAIKLGGLAFSQTGSLYVVMV